MVASCGNPDIFLLKSSATIADFHLQGRHNPADRLRNEAAVHMTNAGPENLRRAAELLRGRAGRLDRNAAPNPLFIKVTVE